MKKLALVLGSLLIAATASAKEVVAAPVVVAEPVVEEVVPVVVPEFKHWYLKAGVSHLERQQGRMEDHGYEYGVPDDLGEDGDVTEFFTTLGYKFDEKWAVDYKYSYGYVDNIEGGYDSKKLDDESATMQNHTVRLIRTFAPFDFMGKTWDSSAWIGGRRYRESSISNEDSDVVYNGFVSNRFLANANMNTSLTEQTALDLNYMYQYRTYDYLEDSTDEASGSNNQHRHFVSATIDHEYNDSFYSSFDNTLYMKQNVSNEYNYGEWDPTYVLLGHNYSLPNGYAINTEATVWAELPLWLKGHQDKDEHNQAEAILMPKLKKTFTLADDMKLNTFIGAGYVYGFDPQTGDEEYAGFEGRVGANIDYKF